MEDRRLQRENKGVLAELRIKKLGEPMKVHRLQKDVVVGRDSTCDVILESDFVSRQHARVRLHRGTYSIEDLGSLNGVFVNGKRIQGRQRLKSGDEVGLSDCLLVYWETRGGEPGTLSYMGPAVSEALRVNAEAHEVWLGVTRVDIELTPNEFRVLSLLFDHRHHVCTTTEIGEAIWGSYAVGDRSLPAYVPNSVQVLVGRLRKKLAKSLGRSDYVVNVRGAGYRLDERPEPVEQDTTGTP